MSTPPEPAPTTAPAPPPGAAPGDDFVAELGTIPHDRRDPDQWWALYTDRSLPLDPQVKAALVLDARSFSRRFLLPLLRPLARGLLILVGAVSHAGPARADVVVAAAPADLLRAPPLRQPAGELPDPPPLPPGVERGRVPGRELGRRASRPFRCGRSKPADVKDHLFLQHDLNLYNFVISLNAALAAEDRGLSPPARIDFDAIDERAHPVPAVSARPVQLPRLDLGDRALHAALSPAARAARLRAREPVAAARRDRRHLRGADPGRHHAPRADQQPPPVGAAVVAARRLPPGAARARHRDAARRAGPAQARRRLRRRGLEKPASASRASGADKAARDRSARHSRRAPSARAGLRDHGRRFPAHLLRRRRVDPPAGHARFSRPGPGTATCRSRARAGPARTRDPPVAGLDRDLRRLRRRSRRSARAPACGRCFRSRSLAGVALELAFLVLWNDLHFYAIHRVLHGALAVPARPPRASPRDPSHAFLDLRHAPDRGAAARQRDGAGAALPRIQRPDACSSSRWSAC